MEDENTIKSSKETETISNNEKTNKKNTKDDKGRKSREKSRKDRDTDDKLMSGPPIDYSFKNLVDMSNLKNERPRAIRVGRSPKRGPNSRFLTCSVWLNNNEISDLKTLNKLIDDLLEKPEKLGWLDLSFNNISELNDNLLKYQELKILYLHGNNITEYKCVEMLKGIPKLRTLTLQGNPIETIPNYRNYVIHLLPQIVNLDFAPVIPSERLICPPVGWNKKKK